LGGFVVYLIWVVGLGIGDVDVVVGEWGVGVLFYVFVWCWYDVFGV